jgi:hypothetical protein
MYLIWRIILWRFAWEQHTSRNFNGYDGGFKKLESGPDIALSTHEGQFWADGRN